MESERIQGIVEHKIIGSTENYLVVIDLREMVVRTRSRYSRITETYSITRFEIIDLERSMKKNSEIKVLVRIKAKS